MLVLRDFQREDVETLKASNLRALVASAPGTGKTPIAVRALAEAGKEFLPAVVICPASVLKNWGREIKKWGKNLFPILVENSEAVFPQHRNAVYIVSWSLLEARWSDLVKAGVKTAIADEAHYAKNPSSLRSKALFHLTQRMKGVLLLTGTPIVNTKTELEVLTGYLGQNPPMIRRLLEDVAPDIPPKQRAYLYVKLRAKDQATYDKANNDFETWLRKEKEKLLGEGMAEHEVERALAAEALAKVGYLRRLGAQCKVPAAADWISRAIRIGEPVVVFVEHQATLSKLSRTLRKQRIRHEILEGSTSPKKRQEIIDRFQRYEFPVFLCSKAGKEGITLTAARHLLFVERFFTAADEEQAEDRIRRIGQRHKTTIWFLHAVGTIDERIDHIVRRKRRVVRTAIGAPDIMETPIGNVESILQTWSEYAEEEHTITPLGLGEPLPPLPSPKSTYAIVFYGTRWNTKTALIWCKMNGYLPQHQVKYKDRFKLVLHPPEVFSRNRFSVFYVSQDIRIILGQRLSKANERKAVKAKKRSR